MSQNKKNNIFRAEALRYYIERRSDSIPRFFMSRPVRVPVLLQLSSAECGAACLAMILSYYKKASTVREIQKFMDIGRDGTSAKAIIETASHFGLRAKLYSLQNLADFKDVKLPIIAHWNFSHFIIVERWGKDKVEVVDPAIGRRTLSQKEFSNSFTGVFMTFEPGESFVLQSKDSNGIWRKYFELLKNIPDIRKLFGQMVIITTGLQVFGLILPLFTQQIIDRVIPGNSINMLNMIGMGCVILLLTEYSIRTLRDKLLNFMQAQTDYYIMSKFVDHLLSLPLPYFLQRTTGDLMLRLNSNVFIREIITIQSLSLVLDGTFSLVYFFILFFLSPILALLAALVLSLQLIIIMVSNKKIAAKIQNHILAQSEEQGYLTEVLSNMTLLKSSGAERAVHNYWLNLFTNQLNMSVDRNKISSQVETLIYTIRLLTPIILIWLGGGQVLQGELSLGNMLALNAIAFAAIEPAANIIRSSQYYLTAGLHLERTLDVAEATPEQTPNTIRHSKVIEGNIKVENLSFRYNSNSPFILEDININILPNQTIAIVGHTGSGKSTLLNLLLGLYQPTGGKIYYDGNELESLNLQSIRQQIGLVLQSPFLFGGSIRQNITFFSPDVSMTDIVEATRLACMDKELEQLPLGYDTIISEGGSSLSGGQRQRLALVRAIIKKPKILFLDEATSHLDSLTEKHIMENLKKINSVKVIVAHRLSTIRHADFIFVINQGKIVETGSHEKLISLQGYYKRYFESQMTG